MATIIEKRIAPVFSTASILAIVCAIASIFTGGWGIFLAVTALVLGAIGALIALAPGVRGGFISVVSILLAAIGIIVALLSIIF